MDSDTLTEESTVAAQDILSALEHHRDELRELGVKKLGLFGSASRGELRAESDLDFVVELQHKSLDNLLRIKFLLEDTFHRRVDVVLTQSLRPEIRERVLRETRYVSGL
ncbi:MAG: nucleotidyltransferase domain-containing protein [Chloroflexi bacterium]|nr:nucleotidyltransferase domain-containing protein [Chloroflexota bacterium]